MRNHWENDRDPDIVIDFADDEMVLNGMKHWLGIDESTDVDEEHMQTAFEGLRYGTQVTVLEEYIEYEGLTKDFNEWYSAKYDSDEDEDDDQYDYRGEMDDAEFERYRDEQYFEKGGWN